MERISKIRESKDGINSRIEEIEELISNLAGERIETAQSK